jgi:hypothetical protein
VLGHDFSRAEEATKDARLEPLRDTFPTLTSMDETASSVPSQKSLPKIEAVILNEVKDLRLPL